MSRPPASRFIPSERQKQILRDYRKNKNMVSLSQHILINQCQIETDLPLSYIKSWIGNQNAKDKGKRYGGAHYKQVGKPRMIHGYNLFCRETPFPDHLKGALLSVKNKWWKAQWDALSLSQQNEYNLRARMTSKEQVTENLSGEALKLRKEFLIKRVNYYLNELSKGGAEGFAMFWTGEKMAYVASKHGRGFLHHQAVRSEETLADLKSYVSRAKATLPVPPSSDIPVSTPDSASATATTSLDGFLVEGMISTARVLNSSGECEETPIVMSASTGESSLTGTSVQIENIPIDDIESSDLSPIPPETETLTEMPELEGVKTFTVQVVNISSENSVQESVIAGPSCSDNEDEEDTNRFPSHAPTTGISQTTGDSVQKPELPATTKRATAVVKKDLLGKTVEELWHTEDPLNPRQWYRGTIVQRSKGQLAIKFLGERKLRNITVFEVKELLKEETLRFVSE